MDQDSERSKYDEAAFAEVLEAETQENRSCLGLVSQKWTMFLSLITLEHVTNFLRLIH